MFERLSLAGTGGIVVLIEFALKLLNIDVPGGAVGDTVNAIITVWGTIILIWGQVRRKDLHFGLIRKDTR